MDHRIQILTFVNGNFSYKRMNKYNEIKINEYYRISQLSSARVRLLRFLLHGFEEFFLPTAAYSDIPHRRECYLPECSALLQVYTHIIDCRSHIALWQQQQRADIVHCTYMCCIILIMGTHSGHVGLPQLPPLPQMSSKTHKNTYTRTKQLNNCAANHLCANF